MSTEKQVETIKVEQQEAVKVITLNRPEKLNALSTQCCDELLQSLKAADDDANTHVSIITGSGRVFCAGADIEEMNGWTAEQVVREQKFVEMTSVKDLKKPVIAAVNGAAMGGGCELAMLCDIIIASEKAFFAQPETTVGLIPGMGGTQRLVRAVGKSKAMELILTGATKGLTAEEAHQYGLVSRVVPHEQLFEEAMQLAKRIASRSNPIVIKAKQCINDAYERHLKDGLDEELRQFWSCFGLQDSKEGLSAFLQKREPKFRNA